jgi:hypothetical protein
LREIYEGNLEGGLLYPKDILSKALEMDVCFQRGPAFGEYGGMLLSWGLSKKGTISLFTEIFMRNLRDVKKKKSCKWAALSIGALLGNLERVHLLGRLREKENAYLGSFFLDPEDIKS